MGPLLPVPDISRNCGRRRFALWPLDSCRGRWHRRPERGGPGNGSPMDIEGVPTALSERLGTEATVGLLQLLDHAHEEWREDVIGACAERFERRLVAEVAGMRVQLAQVEAAVRQGDTETRASLRQEMAAMGTMLRQEIATGDASLRQEITALRHDMATGRFELLKWCFLFWIGQVIAISGILSVMLRLALR
jgi:hypothetical protein